MARKLDITILDLIEQSARNTKAHPLNLGGLAGIGGGVGSPPGGFIGWLPQTRVAYDEDEIASSGTSISGSLLDNLNHIRYRLGVVESGGVAGTITVIDDNTSSTYSLVDTIHFVGSGVLVTDLGGGDVEVRIDATSSGGGSNALEDLTDVLIASIADQDILVYSGAINKWVNVQPLSDVPDDDIIYGRKNGQWVQISGIVSSGITVEELDGIPSITDVSTIIIQGGTVTDNGGGTVTIAFSGGGSSTEETLHYYNDDLTDQAPSQLFTTTNVYISGTLRLYYNGIRQRKGTHYLDDIEFTTFSTYFATYSGDVITVDYNYLESQQSSTEFTMIDSDGIIIIDSDGQQLTESL